MLTNSHVETALLEKMRIFSISDVHIDFKDNWEWIQNLPEGEYKQDALIVAGDVTHELSKLEEFFAVLLRKFAFVFFVPGNHELWVSSSDKNCSTSVEKFHKVLELCKRMGVLTHPAKVGRERPVWVVPLFSWYHQDFDDDLTTKNESIESWTDFHLCKWPQNVLSADPITPSSPLGTPVDWFLGLNEEVISREYDAPVLSFSHFLPHRNCMPDKSKLFIKFLPKVVGTTELDKQIRMLKSVIHVFGHTHILWNRQIDGIWYTQRCLKYPRERSRWPNYAIDKLEEMLIWDDSLEEPNRCISWIHPAER